MDKVAVVFPGQGSQVVGMGKDLAVQYRGVREVFEEADDVLGFSLSALCFEGPDEQLTRTENTQPALLATSIAIYRLLEGHGFSPAVAAGHSLGEYSALVAAGAISYSDALRTVRLRGKLMEAAVPAGRGTMGAILGLDDDVVREVCSAVPGVVEPAGFNAPGQVVVAGEVDAVRKALDLAKERGSRRTQLLNVSGPFHSSLLSGAGDELADWLAGVEIQTPRIPVVANVTARPAESADEIRRNLALQVSSPVRFVECVEWMVQDGVSSFVEAGPGRVLSGLIRRIHRAATVKNVESAQDFSAFSEA